MQITTPQELKDYLLSLDGNYFINNNYLDDYCKLIFKNINLKKVPFKTQTHHTLPCCYFKLMFGYTRRECDKFSDNILVNLFYNDHVLAHYYLSMCSCGKLKKSLCLGLIKLLDTKENKDDTISSLELNAEKLNAIYSLGRSHTDEWRKNHSKMMTENNPFKNHIYTKQEKDKISSTLKYKHRTGELFDSEETRKKKSRPGKLNSMYGTTYVWVNDGVHQYRWDKDKALPDGYKYGILNRRQVFCYSTDGKFICSYPNTDIAAKEVGVSGSMIRKVCLGKNNTAGGYIWSYTLKD